MLRPRRHPALSGQAGSDQNVTVGSRAFGRQTQWPQELKKGWQVEVGTGYSSPLVADGLVYQHARQGDDEVVYCFDLKTGELKWRQSYEVPFKASPGGERHGAGPKSSPALADGRLFTMSILGDLTAWDAESGKLLWRTDYGLTLSAESSELGRRDITDRRRTDASSPTSATMTRGRSSLLMSRLEPRSGAREATALRTPRHLWLRFMECGRLSSGTTAHWSVWIASRAVSCGSFPSRISVPTRTCRRLYFTADECCWVAKTAVFTAWNRRLRRLRLERQGAMASGGRGAEHEYGGGERRIALRLLPLQ